MTPPTSKQELSLPRERSGMSPSLLTSEISMECYASAINLTQFSAVKEIETPLGMDDTQQMWRWADVGSCQVPRSPPMYPTLMLGEEGVRQPVASQVHHKTLFQWIVGNLSWLSQYDTVYIFVDNRALPGASPPDYWPFFAPWIKSRCEVMGPYQEKTTAVYILQTLVWTKSTTLGPVPQSSKPYVLYTLQ